MALNSIFWFYTMSVWLDLLFLFLPAMFQVSSKWLYLIGVGSRGVRGQSSPGPI